MSLSDVDTIFVCSFLFCLSSRIKLHMRTTWNMAMTWNTQSQPLTSTLLQCSAVTCYLTRMCHRRGRQTRDKRSTNWSTQCAVVSTHWAATNDPAQRELRAFLLRSAICHGQLRGRDSSPPTILAPLGGSTGRPQVSGSRAAGCRCARSDTSCDVWRWRRALVERCDVANWRRLSLSSPDSSVGQVAILALLSYIIITIIILFPNHNKW